MVPCVFWKGFPLHIQENGEFKKGDYYMAWKVNE